MLKFFIIIFFISINFAFAQFTSTIKGTVSSIKTGEPLSNVNVYISGTTWGTTTDQKGFYIIKNLPTGQQCIVASLVGYRPGSVDITLLEDSTKEICFNLEEIVYELKTIDITSEVPKEWKENLEKFKELFLGKNLFAGDCIILNPEVININKPETGELYADARQPLTIFNYALGYKIVCDLIYFKWDNQNQNLRYSVNSYFIELEDTSGKLKNGWLKNREKIYDGSTANFIKCLSKNSLYENNFLMWVERKPSKSGDNPQTEKPKVDILEDGSVKLKFDQYLHVEYLPRFSKKEVSWIRLNQPYVIFDKYGYPVGSFPIEVYGFWAFKGISYTLPKYYCPPVITEK